MAYNTSFTRYKSSLLIGLDCGTSGVLRGQRLDQNNRYYATFTATEAVEVGECIAMIRVPAGTTVVGGWLAFNDLGSGVQLALGDPYACGRLVGPILATRGSGLDVFSGSILNCSPVFVTKLGTVGDGCGIGYTYTCETDIIVTNLYGAESANQGGWAGGAGPSSGQGAGATIASGKTIRVVLDVLPV